MSQRKRYIISHGNRHTTCGSIHKAMTQARFIESWDEILKTNQEVKVYDTFRKKIINHKSDGGF